MEATELADRLLDAQVKFVLAELSGKRLAQVLARDVDDLLTIADACTVADVLEPDVAKRILRRIVDQVGASTLPQDLVTAVCDAIYDLPASDDYDLGDVVARDPVEALVVKVLSMRTLHERALSRMNDSPLVARVAQRFVSTIVNDFIAQNRQMAERLPGAKSLFSLGSSAARAAGRVPIVNAAADKGTKLAIRQTTGALRDMFTEAPLRGAAMEIWDLHADERISELREYMSKQELLELVALIRDVLASARSNEYVGELVDECVDVFFAGYGDRTLGSLLAELGVSRDDLVADLRAAAPRLIEAVRADGRLEALIRSRLEPFYTSKQVRSILAGEAASPAPRVVRPSPGNSRSKRGQAG